MVLVGHDAREKHGFAAGEHVRQRIGKRLGALRIVTAVDDHRGFARHVRQHLEPAGPARGGNTALDSGLRYIPTTALKREHGFQSQCGVLGLIAAQQCGFVSVALVGEGTGDRRLAGFDLLGVKMADRRNVQFAEIRVRNRAACRVRRRFHGFGRLGLLRPRNHGASRLDDASLFSSDLADGVAEQIGMVEADARDNGNVGGRDDVGGVQTAAKADLKHRNLTSHLGEMQKRHRRHKFELRWMVTGFHRHLLGMLPHLQRDARKVGHADVLAVHADALLETLDERA